jgi:hypothetical protein
MSINYRNEIADNCKLLLLITAGILSALSSLSRADETAIIRTSPFERADVETIKMHTRQILSEPALASRKTFQQWLLEKFSKWKRPEFDLGSGWATLIWSVILIWCILTLSAILVHLIWTIRLYIRPNSHRKKTASGAGSKQVRITSFEELYIIAKELADKGAFSEAISAMLAGLLRLLDSLGTLCFHESKTNGDYIREYPSNLAGRNEFRKFILIFEQVIYGRFCCDRQTYSQLNSLMECIRNGVTQKA